jgi:hypothetical protein
MISPDYNDDEAKKEINSDELISSKQDDAEYKKRIEAAAGIKTYLKLFGQLCIAVMKWRDNV